MKYNQTDVKLTVWDTSGEDNDVYSSFLFGSTTRVGSFFIPPICSRGQENLFTLEIQQMIISARPDHVKANMPSPTATPWRHYVWVLTGGDDDKKIFDNVIMICIVLNMLQMALSYEGAP